VRLLDHQANMNRQVLISYHKSDDDLVKRFDRDLTTRGLNVWIDSRNVHQGQPRRQTVYEAIMSADCVIACLSPRFLEDEFCRTQLFLAGLWQANPAGLGQQFRERTKSAIRFANAVMMRLSSSTEANARELAVWSPVSPDVASTTNLSPAVRDR
jgi:hypothetical protein